MQSIDYLKYAVLFKALSDPNRLMIIDMLSRGEMCACHILEAFEISQPTLSHHMKTLCDSDLVKSRREGKWMHYTLNDEVIRSLRAFLAETTTSSESCICKGETYDEAQ